MHENLAAVIVTYNPQREELKKLASLISKQVAKLYIVDNGSDVRISSCIEASTELIELCDNYGIAKAQNTGIDRAIKDGFTDFILFDQDSQPAENMVEQLMTTRQLVQNSGVKVAAVGPLHIDQDDFSECVYVDTSKGSVEKIIPSIVRTSGNSFVSCDFLIASGCLISKESLDVVGFMEDDLFIDCVDIEWGYRALSKGLHCIAALEAKMYHKIGDKPLTILGRNLTTHSPIRHYYFYRNFYTLLKRSYIPSCWKRYTLVKSTIQAFAFSLFLTPRFKQFNCIIKGIFHGIIGCKGKYE